MSAAPDKRPNAPEGNIGGRFVRGAAWMLAAKLAERGIGLVSTLILARLLWPEDFGLVAMAAPIIALVELLGAWGIDSALIQRRDLKRAHLDTAFTLNVLVCVVMALVLWVLAPFAADYFREPRLAPVIGWLALGSLIQGLSNPGFVMFRKDINMVPEVVLLLAKKGSSLAIAVVAALILGNYWALVWGTLASRCVGVAVSYMMTPYRPQLSLAERRSVLGFSLWMLVVQVLYYLQLRANDLIIGRLLGAPQLAFFNVSVDLGASVPGEAMVAVSRAAFPAFAKINDDRVRLAEGLQKVLSGVAVFALPAALGIAASSDLLVAVLLGARWTPVAELLPAIATSAATLGIVGQISYVYMALGKPRLAAFVSAGSVIVLVSVSLATIPTRGLAGVCLAYPAMAGAAFVGHVIVLSRVLPEFRITDWLGALWRPLLSSTVMYGLVSWASSSVMPITSSSAGILPLVGMIGLGAMVFAAMLLALWHLTGRPDGVESMIWRQVMKRVRR